MSTPGDFDPTRQPEDPYGRPLAQRYASESEVPHGPLPAALGEVVTVMARAAEKAHEHYELLRQEFLDAGGTCFKCQDSGLSGERAGFCDCAAGRQAARRHQDELAGLAIMSAGGNAYAFALNTWPGPKGAATDIERWLGGDFPQYPWLLMVGITGTGKSQVAAYAMRQLLRQRIYQGQPDRAVAAFIDCNDLIDELGQADQAREAPLYQRARDTPIVVLDDLGSWNHTDPRERRIFAIVNARYVARRTTIITTNLDPNQGALQASIGDRSFGRIMELSLAIRMGDTNLRLKNLGAR